MADIKPLLVIPRTPSLARAFDDDFEILRVSPRAKRNGIVVIAPRETKPDALMAACQAWPSVLRHAGITRVAVVLSVQAFTLTQPLLQGRIRFLKVHGISLAFFHEGHLESDAIIAWFERRKARRHVTSNTMVKLSQRYAERGDARAAFHAIMIAEQLER